MKIEINQAHTIVLFAVFFIITGWVAPAAYAAYAPQEQFITVNKFTAENTTTAVTSHQICFERNVRQAESGKIFTELYLLNQSTDTTRQVDTTTMERYFHDGNFTVQTSFKLPRDLRAGEYQYILIVRMDLAKGRVGREFEFTSNTFTVTNTNESAQKQFSC